jgi:methylmalonyl-CoA/ethylmalonyl-CoA epimerase
VSDVAGEFGELVERLDHVSMAVWDIAAAASLAELLGGEFFDGGLNHTGDFYWAQWVVPSGKLEMIAPVDREDEGNFLVRFLRQHGEGFHHITLKVSDIEAAAARADRMGFDVVGLNLEHESWKEAFVHPHSANGLLIQLAEWTDHPAPKGRALHDVLETDR